MHIHGHHFKTKSSSGFIISDLISTQQVFFSLSISFVCSSFRSALLNLTRFDVILLVWIWVCYVFVDRSASFFQIFYVL
ncbi:hypothetical protein Hdeb2414_s0004g00150721 [Helianthus debilis subsp. tardiflorus]